MKSITSPQLKLIHVLLNEAGLMERKQELIQSFTSGRTISCRDMYMTEAKELIEWLKGTTECKGMIRHIWFLSYNMGIIEKGDNNEQAMNAAKLDAFCKQYGSVKKPLGEQSISELKRTVNQFEAMRTKYEKKQEQLVFLARLEKELKEAVTEENYEVAVGIKKLIDEVRKELQPKRKQKATTV